MAYERITYRTGKGIAVKETSFNDNKSIFNAIERLAELEDKIEQGTLKEEVKADLSIIEYEYFTCSNCGHFIWSGAESTAEAKERLANGEYPNYCEHCGARLKELEGGR